MPLGLVIFCRILRLNFTTFCSGRSTELLPATVLSALNNVLVLESLGTLQITMIVAVYSDEKGHWIESMETKTLKMSSPVRQNCSLSSVMLT